MTLDDPSGHAKSQYTDFSHPTTPHYLSQALPRRYTYALMPKMPLMPGPHSPTC